MNCIKCNAELPIGSNYCRLCGKKQVAEERKRRKRAKPWAAKRNGVYIGTF